MINLYSHHSADIPYDAMSGFVYSPDNGINSYKFRVVNLDKDSFIVAKKSLIYTKLNTLIAEATNGRSQLRDEDYRVILEKLHESVDDNCKRALDAAGFEAVSKYSLYSNSRAANKIEALVIWSKSSQSLNGHANNQTTVVTPTAALTLYADQNNEMQERLESNYQSMTGVDDFPEYGRNSDYCIQIAPFNKVSLHSIVSTIYKQKQETVYGVDLGTGIGNVPKALNENFNGKVIAKGITAKTASSEEAPPDHIIYGNIEDLPNIGTRGVDFFVSVHTFPYLGDPLKVISDAYAMLNKGGVLLLDHVYIALPGLNQSFFQYLRDQGYEIVAGLNGSTECSRPGWWGPGFVFIRKNDMETLTFPVEKDRWEKTTIKYKYHPDPFTDEGWHSSFDIQYAYYKMNETVHLPDTNLRSHAAINRFNIKMLDDSFPEVVSE